MDLERRLVSSSSSSSSLPSSAAEIGEDRMVEMELEAAEALADLAYLAMRENVGAVETATTRECKGKRVRKRGKTESPPGQSESDLNPEQTVVDQQRDQTCGNVTIKWVKAEEDAESLKSSSMCTTRCVSMGGGRSRQNLTEAEKEERRIRRVLANRESARQTIRRRQALCEELTRKASDLVQENESLKKEKELAFKEYQFLETRNKLLKAQVAKTMRAEVGETKGEVNSAHGESSSTSTNCPLAFYNHHPFSPLGWLPIMQASLPVQSRHGQQKAVTFPSNISSPMSVNLPSSQEQENPTDINATRTPLYLVPCPWFLPLQDNENDIPVESSSDGGGAQHNGHHPREATLSPAPLCSVGSTFIVNRENVLQSGYSYNNTEDVSKKASSIVSALPEKKLPVNYPSKKLVDAGAAAEARKRRKAITKLKNLHGRQCRMHC